MKKLSKEQRRDIAVIAAKGDEDIDFSDIPLTLDDELLNFLGISERDPRPYTDSLPRTYHE